MGMTAGFRVGPYEITAPIGAGGMGEVYRARDTNLKRDVAIKVLPADVGADRERLARFQREAEVLASLNHPHIAQIYGLERSGETIALVMELVDGEDLSARLKLSALPLDEALPMARQIADALDAAHDSGIIHRDLKPANIKVRPDGTVKVLDFGLAKALEPSAQDAGASIANSPTITSPAMTMRGVILGTAAYMSPEQAKGRAVDRRADIWAFGCVLYEMLTARRTFEGSDTSETLAAILRAVPDWSALPAECPESVRRLLRRCLEKDPARRLKHIGDARLELDYDDGGSATSYGRTGSPMLSRVAWLLAAVAVAGVAAFTLRSSAPAGEAIHLSIWLPSARTMRVAGGGAGVTISPDGKSIAFTSGQNGALILRRLDSPDLIELPVRGTSPFFSPDSQWIGYIDQGTVKKLRIGESLPTALCQVDGGGSSSWADAGFIVTSPSGDLLRCSDSGEGAAEPLLKTGVATGGIGLQPVVLPGSKAVLIEHVRDGRPMIRALTLADRSLTDIAPGGSPRIIGGDLLLFQRDDALWAAPFDVRALRVTREPVPVLGQIRMAGPRALYAGSAAGTLVFMTAGSSASTSLVWIDRDGRTTPALSAPGSYSEPQLSPDGRRVVVTLVSGSVADLSVYDLERGSGRRLTTEGARRPRWSADDRIAYQTNNLEIVARRADGLGDVLPLVARPGGQFPDGWSPDGRTLVYNEGAARRDLWAVTEGREPTRLLPASAFHERGGRVSPDGRWLAFVSNESGRDEVYIQPFPDSGPKIAISTGGGKQPVWARNGKELFYREHDHMMAVPIATEPFRAGTPAALFELKRTEYGDDLNRVEYDVAPDGRFIAARLNREDRPEEIQVILNWAESFRRQLAR